MDRVCNFDVMIGRGYFGYNIVKFFIECMVIWDGFINEIEFVY